MVATQEAGAEGSRVQEQFSQILSQSKNLKENSLLTQLRGRHGLHLSY
jgi:hypothetical protein